MNKILSIEKQRALFLVFLFNFDHFFHVSFNLNSEHLSLRQTLVLTRAPCLICEAVDSCLSKSEP